MKTKTMSGFLCSKNIANNVEAFLWGIKLRINPLFLKSGPIVFYLCKVITDRITHFYFTFLQAQKKELDLIRQNYRRNSLARTPASKRESSKIEKPIEEND